MSDWKAKIDKSIRKQHGAKTEAEVQQRNRQHEKEQREWQASFKGFQARFVCHICGQPSQKPKTDQVMISPGASGDGFGSGAGHNPTYKEVVDFNTPADMTKCIRCHNWTHFEHVHRGICQRCAEQL